MCNVLLGTSQCHSRLVDSASFINGRRLISGSEDIILSERQEHVTSKPRLLRVERSEVLFFDSVLCIGGPCHVRTKIWRTIFKRDQPNQNTSIRVRPGGGQRVNDTPYCLCPVYDTCSSAFKHTTIFGFAPKRLLF